MHPDEVVACGCRDSSRYLGEAGIKTLLCYLDVDSFISGIGNLWWDHVDF